MGNIPARQHDGAAVLALQAGNGPQQGRLAATGRAQQAHQLACPDIQRNIGQRPLSGWGMVPPVWERRQYGSRVLSVYDTSRKCSNKNIKLFWCTGGLAHCVPFPPPPSCLSPNSNPSTPWLAAAPSPRPPPSWVSANPR
ncbi:hypothetical protein G6F22_017130 [Rhizopus arrhizus]|nr:hypothetical protein G6F22_017130 [Rhizopus arrhizus]